VPMGPLFADDDDNGGGGWGGGGGSDSGASISTGISDLLPNWFGGGGDSTSDSVGSAASAEKSAANAGADNKGSFANSEQYAVAQCEPAPAKPPPPLCSVDKIKKNLATCDGGTNAWALAKKAAGKDPTVQIKKTESGFSAETHETTITIAPTTDCCDATESLLFELHNIESKPLSDKIDSDAAVGNYSREDYARACEHLEYDGLKRSWETFDKCSAKWGCGPGAKSFASGFRNAKDFDTYYDHFLGNDHKDVYRNFWDTKYKDVYDARHNSP